MILKPPDTPFAPAGESPSFEGPPGPAGPAGPQGPSGVGDGGVTVDTGQEYKVIMFSDGSVRAIPASAVAPAVPTGLAVTPHVASANLTWNAVSGAASYKVLRNGSTIGTATSPNYRDGTVTTGGTYTWTVQSADGYGQRSVPSASVTAFIDPALNVAPSVTVVAWPALASTNGRTLIRVNGSDLDAQQLAYALSVDAGSIEATEDPTAWMYTP